MKKLLVWFNAIRPYSLPASIAPVILGICMAYGDGFHHWPSALAALGIAIFIQIGTNLSNDYYDFTSGVDVLGMGRGDSSILKKELSLDEVKWGFIAAFLMAALLANFLILRIGTPAVVIIVLSIIAGLWYTAGKWSLARLGLGDIVVLIFFGPVATAGTYYAIAFEYNAAVVWAGLMSGFLATCILVVNNLRDITSDAKAGRITWAVRFGKAFTRMEYLFGVLASAAMPVIVYYITDSKPLTLLCSGSVLLAIPLVHTVFTSDDPKALNQALGMTAMLLLLQALAYGFIWLL